MNEQARRTMMDLADTIKGEINRMCVTNDLCELDTMALHATNNIKKLQNMRFADFRTESGARINRMKLLRVPDNIEIIPSRKSGKHYTQLATNKDILTSVIETCKQFHINCETCPYWLKNKFGCIWYSHKIIGKDVMAYWDIGEIEER